MQLKSKDRSRYPNTRPMKPIDELLLMQSKGQILNGEEKERIVRYEKDKRKQKFYN